MGPRRTGGGAAIQNLIKSLALRPYQLETISAIESSQASRQLVVLPTGSGKTVVFCELISRQPGRSVVLAHREELIDQAGGKMEMVRPGTSVGVVQAGRDDTHRSSWRASRRCCVATAAWSGSHAASPWPSSTGATEEPETETTQRSRHIGLSTWTPASRSTSRLDRAGRGGRVRIRRAHGRGDEVTGTAGSVGPLPCCHGAPSPTQGLVAPVRSRRPRRLVSFGSTSGVVLLGALHRPSVGAGRRKQCSGQLSASGPRNPLQHLSLRSARGARLGRGALFRARRATPSSPVPRSCARWPGGR